MNTGEQERFKIRGGENIKAGNMSADIHAPACMPKCVGTEACEAELPCNPPSKPST